MTDQYNPNTDLDTPEMQEFIDQMAVQVASKNMASATLCDEIQKRAEALERRRAFTHLRRALISSRIDMMIGDGEVIREELEKLQEIGLQESAHYQTRIEDLKEALETMRVEIDNMIKEHIR